ncbi:hypothetical protein [Oerskovia turbata]
MPDDELYTPVLYSGWWAVLGVGLVLLVAGWVVFALVSTRASAEERNQSSASRGPSGPFDPYAGLRAEFESRLATVEARYLAGELDERALHLTLSKEVRGFASGRLGVDASVLTLSEIERLTGAQHLTSLVARYYRPSFAEHPDAPAQGDAQSQAPEGRESIDRARTVVRTW